MTRIGFSLQADYGLPITQVIALLKASGFTAVSPVWSQDLDLKSIAKSLAEHNMTFQSLHAPDERFDSLVLPHQDAIIMLLHHDVAVINVCCIINDMLVVIRIVAHGCAKLLCAAKIR